MGIDILRRLLGLTGGQDSAIDDRSALADRAPVAPEVAPAVVAPPPVSCPSCGALLDPPPPRNRLCPSCRQPIVVRRVDGRVVYLTEAALAVFEAERRRHADEREWTAARLQWLHLATTVKASPARRKRLADAPLSAAVVEASRALYLATAEKAVRAARHEKRWGDVGTIRREQAAALYSEAGSPVPPPAEIAELHSDGMAAVLRSLALIARDVEIVSMACCRPCRADDGRTFRIADELRVARLPHAGCPHGLCGCEWWPAVVQPAKRRRRTAPRSASPVSGAGTGGSDAPVSSVGTDERDAERVDPEPVDAIASGTAGGRPDGSSPPE